MPLAALSQAGGRGDSIRYGGRLMVRSRPAPLLAIVALLAIAACAPAVSTSPPSPTSSPGTPSGSARPASPRVTQPATSASPSGPVARELPPPPTVLDAGRYTRPGFEPRITFEVAAGEWQAAQQLEGFFDIQRDAGTPDVIAVQFARPSGAYGAGGAVVTVASAAEAAAAIEANPGLVVLGTSDSRMSGRTGIVLEVENPASSGAHVEVLRVPPGPLGIDAGRRLWIALFDTPEGLLAILVGGSVATWDAALLAAEPVLETVTIGD